MEEDEEDMAGKKRLCIPCNESRKRWVQEERKENPCIIAILLNTERRIYLLYL